MGGCRGGLYEESRSCCMLNQSRLLMGLLLARAEPADGAASPLREHGEGRGRTAGRPEGWHL